MHCIEGNVMDDSTQLVHERDDQQPADTDSLARRGSDLEDDPFWSLDEDWPGQWGAAVLGIP